MSRLQTLLSDIVSMTGLLLVIGLAVGVWGAGMTAAIWLCLTGFWFFGVPLVALVMAAAIVVTDEYC